MEFAKKTFGARIIPQQTEILPSVKKPVLVLRDSLCIRGVIACVYEE